MRANSLPRSLFAGFRNGRKLSGMTRMDGTARMQGFRLGDAVIDATTGDVVGDTGDMSSLPADYQDGIASGQYYTVASGGASSPAALPGSPTSGPADWLSKLTTALPAVSSFITAEQLAQVNVKRAQQGLPALQASQYAPSVGVTVSPNTTKALTLGAIAVAAVLILPRMFGRRRA